MSSIQGWGRGTWGSGAWNGPETIAVTGVQITSGAGTITQIVSNQAAPTGVAMTSAVGTITANIGTNVNPTGVSMTASAARLFLYFPIDTSQTANYTPIER
jgi:hypothetical protein